MRWKLLRRRLSISAPRMSVRRHLPWPLRWAVLALALGFSAALALWAFEAGKSIAGLDRRSAEELEQLRVEVVRLRGEREKASSIADTADSLLTRLGVADPSAAAFLRIDPVARRLLQGRPGKMVQARAESDGTLIELTARYPAENAEQAASHFTRLSIKRVASTDGKPGKWQARIESAPLTAQVRIGSGTVRGTLFAATDAAGLPDGVSKQLTDIDTKLDDGNLSTGNFFLGYRNYPVFVLEH